MRILKILGLALGAVLMVGAITASMAAANYFHSSSISTTLTVASSEAQKFLYQFGGNTIECSNVGGSGKLSLETNIEASARPTYSSCKVSGIGGSSAEVSMNECEYIFTISAFKNTGKVPIICPKGTQITITVKVIGFSICTLHIPTQTPGGEADYANVGSNVEVQPTQTGIVATRQGSSECGAAQSMTGTYSGKVQVSGEILGQKTGTKIWVG